MPYLHGRASFFPRSSNPVSHYSPCRQSHEGCARRVLPVVSHAVHLACPDTLPLARALDSVSFSFRHNHLDPVKPVLNIFNYSRGTFRKTVQLIIRVDAIMFIPALIVSLFCPADDAALIVEFSA